MIQYRQATARDLPAIRTLIYRVRINPIGLDWRRFLVAADEHDTVIGCGQIKPHGDGTRELASIAILPEYQRRGIGQEIVRRLLAGQQQQLFLTCRASLGAFYERFGFQVVATKRLPPYFRRISRAHRLLRLIFPKMEQLLVMSRSA